MTKIDPQVLTIALLNSSAGSNALASTSTATDALAASIAAGTVDGIE